MFEEAEAINLVRLADAMLVAGDNTGARSLYDLAGDILSQCSDVTDKNAVLYSAAVAYSKGCFHFKAFEVLRRMTTKVIGDRNVDDLVRCAKYQPAQEVIAHDYLEKEDSGCNARLLLDILIDNPFLFPPKMMALKRANVLHRLGMKKEAEIFMEDAKHLEDK